MKTIRTILFVAFAAISFASCQKELTDPSQTQDTPKKYVTFTGMLDDFEAGTKTTMWYQSNLQEGEKLKTYFMNADHIVVNGVESEGDITKQDKHGSEITFVVPFEVGSADAEPPYYAMTVHGFKNYDSSTNTYTLEVGKSQTYSRSNSGKYVTHHTKADILAAYTDGEYNVMQFRHMCTFLAITPQEVNSASEDEKAHIKTIYVRQGDGGNIAGTWTLKFDEGNEPYLNPNETLDNIITYNCVNDDYEVSTNGIPLGEVVMIAVPAYDYPNGLLITMKDNTGKFASFKIKEANYADKGGMIIPFNPEYNPGSGVIKSVEDWNDFAAAINSGDDSKLYRWVGNGTVKLGKDLDDKDSPTPIKSITKPFPYVFDGCGYSITRNTADQALFARLTGEIRKLTLEGKLNLTDNGAPFVKEICAGAKIIDCTNNMEVTFEHNTHCYVTGIAAVAIKNSDEGRGVMEIRNCTNNGKITGTVDMSTDSYNIAVAGIIADIRSAVGDVAYPVEIRNCINTAPITLSPISGDNSTTDKSFCGVGGIVGYVRNVSSLELDDCDNSGAITVSAEQINSEAGLKGVTTAVGGVIGMGVPVSNIKVKDKTNTERELLALSISGQNITIENCDNTGDVYNCMVNASSSSEGLNKVYTGGLAGALLGKATDFAEVRLCSNTGNVITYDITNDDKSKPASSTHCAVAGGLIGCGGNLTIEDCTVNCHIGNGKRQMVSWGGVIGYTVKPFTVMNATLTLGGYFQRISTYNMNRAVVAVVPASTDDIQIDLTDSKIEGQISVTGCMTIGTKTGCLLTTKEYPGGTDTDNLANRELQTVIYTVNNVKGSLVNGKGTYSTVNTSSAIVSYAKAE